MLTIISNVDNISSCHGVGLKTIQLTNEAIFVKVLCDSFLVDVLFESPWRLDVLFGDLECVHL